MTVSRTSGLSVNILKTSSGDLLHKYLKTVGHDDSRNCRNGRGSSSTLFPTRSRSSPPLSHLLISWCEYCAAQAPSLRLNVQRPRYWLRLVTDLNHKKRSMEALRACEQALAEAGYPSCPKYISGTVAELPFPGTKRDYQPTGSGSAPAAAVAEVAGVQPLGESLPLLRKAARLAVPPLCWRKRPPPRLREARLRVMTLDLSWRRAGVGKGGSSSSMAPNARPVGRVTDTQGKNGVTQVAGDLETGGYCSSVAPGTSLEQAVLDAMLAELEPEWTGLHAENRFLFSFSCCLEFFAGVSHTRL